MVEMKSGSRSLEKEGCYEIDFENVTCNYTNAGNNALSAVKA